MKETYLSITIQETEPSTSLNSPDSRPEADQSDVSLSQEPASEDKTALLQMLQEKDNQIKQLEKEIDELKKKNEDEVYQLALMAADKIIPMEVELEKTAKRAKRLSQMVSRQKDSLLCVVSSNKSLLSMLDLPTKQKKCRVI